MQHFLDYTEKMENKGDSLDQNTNQTVNPTVLSFSAIEGEEKNKVQFHSQIDYTMCISTFPDMIQPYSNR